MPALDYFGEIIWLGQVDDRNAGLINAIFQDPQGKLMGGLTRPSCSRVLSFEYEYIKTKEGLECANSI